MPKVDNLSTSFLAPQRHGFSTLELIVSFAILAVALAILLPAIQSSRGPPMTYSFGSDHRSGAYVVFLDGSVHWLSDGISPAVLRGLSTSAGGEVVDWVP